MKKFLTAAVAALTIATTFAAATSDASAKKWGKGWGYGGYGLGIGLGLGVLGAAAYAATAPSCELVPMYNRFGQFVGNRRVCDFD